MGLRRKKEAEAGCSFERGASERGEWVEPTRSTKMMTDTLMCSLRTEGAWSRTPDRKPEAAPRGRRKNPCRTLVPAGCLPKLHGAHFVCFFEGKILQTKLKESGKPPQSPIDPLHQTECIQKQGFGRLQHHQIIRKHHQLPHDIQKLLHIRGNKHSQREGVCSETLGNTHITDWSSNKCSPPRPWMSTRWILTGICKRGDCAFVRGFRLFLLFSSFTLKPWLICSFLKAERGWTQTRFCELYALVVLHVAIALSCRIFFFLPQNL